MGLKLIWYSTALHVGCGYGVLTRALCHRMIDEGHKVKIGTKHNLGGQLVEEGIEIFDGTEIGLVNKIAEEENYDNVISVMDQWVIPNDFAFYNGVAVNFLDTELIHPNLINSLKKFKHVVSVTKHSYKELERVGIPSEYAPLGVDTNLFRPDDELRRSFRKKKGWDDNTFVIGLVGINYATDRKNIINTVRAFQNFNRKYPNSILYLHTDVMGSATKGLPLNWVLQSCGFKDSNEGKSGCVQYSDQKKYHLWAIPQEEVAGLYNAFDVFCLPSHGEGFGMPWLEAQACGTPIINVDTTSGKELNFSGWLIPQKEDYFNYSTLLTWIVKAPPSAIEKMMEKAYKEWESGAIKTRGVKARQKALEYDWDKVYTKYWSPFFKKLEDEKTIVKTLPNYAKEVYNKYLGRVLLEECFNVCKDDTCLKLTDKFKRFKGEWEGPRSVLGRSYPIIPAINGSLWVDRNCVFFQWISPRFIKEITEMWKYLFSYPEIRKQIRDWYEEGYFTLLNKVRLEDLPAFQKFDETYVKAMQTEFNTTFSFNDAMLEGLEKGDRILDVGTGNGKRVKWLNEQGYDAIGTEVNKYWVNNKDIVYGHMHSLPFEDNSFNMVCSIDVLEHTSNPLGALRELFRVSKKYVLVQITTIEDGSMFEDPTHLTTWSMGRWEREINEFGVIKIKFKGAIYLIEKRI